MTNEQTLSTPTTEDELTKALNEAVDKGDQTEIDRLMAVELPEPEVKEEPKVEPEPVIEDPDKTKEVKTEDESSEVVEEEDGKDEAATDKTGAAPTPAKETVVEDTDEVKALKAELHRLKSDAGRVPHMQRKMQELERELRDAKLSRTTAPTGGEASPDNDSVTIPKSLQKRLNALKEIDPDLAETFEETIKELRREVDHVSTSRIKEVTADADARADEEFLAQQFQILVSEVPDAPAIFASPEWQQWKMTLSPARRAFATSQYADEVKIAIQAFVNDMQARAQHTQQPAQVTTQPTQAVPATTDTPEASKVAEARDRKMAASARVPSSVAAKSGTVEIDADKLFADYYKQIQKDNHLNGGK